MNNSELSAQILFSIGPLTISDTSVTSWGITLVLAIIATVTSRRLTASPDVMTTTPSSLSPNKVQTALEGVVLTLQDAIASVAPDHARTLTPFIATLWIFLISANLIGLVPGLHSPTRDLSATTGLAIIVFFAAHWFGIRDQGIRAYLRHYLQPNPILLPFHIVSELTRTLALAVRLFGNIMSLEMAALLILLVAGFLAPIPILMLHIVEALVQAYIFGMLALVYIAGGMQSHRQRARNTETEAIHTSTRDSTETVSTDHHSQEKQL